MFNTDLFDLAEVECADDYAMAREVREWSETLKFLEDNNVRIDKLILKPKTNQMRFTFVPRKADNDITLAFNVNNPPIQFLRKFWELGLSELQAALTKFMVQGYKNKYDDMAEDDKTWLTAAVLGSKNN